MNAICDITVKPYSRTWTCTLLQQVVAAGAIYCQTLMPTTSELAVSWCRICEMDPKTARILIDSAQTARTSFDSTHWEYLAALWASSSEDLTLQGKGFAICTHHDALKWIPSLANLITTTGQVEMQSILIWFWNNTQSWNRKSSTKHVFATCNRWNRQDTTWRQYPWAGVFIGLAHLPSCIWVRWQFAPQVLGVCKLLCQRQWAARRFAEVIAIVRAEHNHISTGECRTLEEFIQKKGANKEG